MIFVFAYQEIGYVKPFPIPNFLVSKNDHAKTKAVEVKKRADVSRRERPNTLFHHETTLCLAKATAGTLSFEAARPLRYTTVAFEVATSFF